MRILTADDQPIILKSIKHKLEQVGFDVIAATNGLDAIEMFDINNPDLVILDLNMPQKSGFEVMEYIRVTKKSRVPIIVMSGNDEETVIVEAFEAGADDYIEKPVGLNEVVVRVKKLLKMSLKSEDFKKGEKKDSGILQKNGVGVVIPCYNEEERLKTGEFANFLENNRGYLLSFVNDGSTDGTLDVLNKFQKQYPDSIKIFNCPQNGGKAEAVRLGMIDLLQDPSLDYLGFLDADLSTNFQDFEDLVKTLSGSEYKLVAGSRIQRIGASIFRQSSRGIISKTVNWIIRKILGMEFQDTQCGAKVMRREVVENLFNEPFLTRWIFDVEIFLRMKNFYGADKVQTMICEQPLKRWVHEDGSKLSMKDSIQIIGQLLQIAIKY
ncbi:response regulator [Arcticibacterium luteifluviistationis]|uniref:dolichyl-phosphate beta-glucosyltransferase n=1 Tax=Arcticibacterium luteifluviistationis TaxID=1784714 RepID=A0A2Z4GDB3_9BACT|nr:response regulator [Arcticibacterium luteifluviistationis]AWV99100.1 transcriptional regulator [Arcticibacterium luteifluviistationis]